MITGIEAFVEKATREQLCLVGRLNGCYNSHAKFRGLGADSLDEIEITMAMEDEYDIEIPDEEARELKTPAQMAAYLNSRLNGKDASLSLVSGQELGHVDG